MRLSSDDIKVANTTYQAKKPTLEDTDDRVSLLSCICMDRCLKPGSFRDVDSCIDKLAHRRELDNGRLVRTRANNGFCLAAPIARPRPPHGSEKASAVVVDARRRRLRKSLNSTPLRVLRLTFRSQQGERYGIDLLTMPNLLLAWPSSETTTAIEGNQAFDIGSNPQLLQASTHRADVAPCGQSKSD